MDDELFAGKPPIRIRSRQYGCRGVLGREDFASRIPGANKDLEARHAVSGHAFLSLRVVTRVDAQVVINNIKCPSGYQMVNTHSSAIAGSSRFIGPVEHGPSKQEGAPPGHTPSS